MVIIVDHTINEENNTKGIGVFNVDKHYIPAHNI